MNDGDKNWKTKQKEILQFSNEHDLLWSIKLRTNSLYVGLPQQLGEGSKNKYEISSNSFYKYTFYILNRFVTLLEFAGDILNCTKVIVYFDKTRSDRAALVKTFMFLGFHVLSPDNTLMLPTDKHPDQLFMVYIIDSDE